MSSPLTVGIVGGGIAGLVCANRCLQLGLTPTVFDTGKRAAGGRCSSRVLNVDGATVVADHAAQYFTVNDKRFEAVVRAWIAAGVCKRWHGTFGKVDRASRFSPDSKLVPYVGTDGMHTVVGRLSGKVSLKQPVWVSRVVRTANGGWQLFDRSTSLGVFSFLVVAHNGKCADRLMKPAKVPRIHKLLRAKFGPTLKSPTQPVMQLNSMWALLVVLPHSQPTHAKFAAASIEARPGQPLAWCGSNTTKMYRSSSPVSASSSVGECWTLLSTAAFGKQHKCPQEAVPKSKAQEVTSALLRAFEGVLGMPPRTLKPLRTRAQLWGAAVPLNGLETAQGQECAFDSAGRVGICGDWLCPSAGVSIEAAALSGIALAEQLARRPGQDVGLHGRFRQARGHSGLGAIPNGRALKGVKSPPLQQQQQQQQQRHRPEDEKKEGEGERVVSSIPGAPPPPPPGQQEKKKKRNKRRRGRRRGRGKQQQQQQ